MSTLYEHRRGIIATILFHLVLIIIFIFGGFTTPLPLPEEEGILINFGYDNQGQGNREPSVSQPAKKEIPPPPVKETEKGKEELLTQDYEKTVALETRKKEKTREELEREAELERLKKQEEEKKRQEELERQKKIEEQRKIDEIYNRTKNAFSRSKNDNNSTGEGDTEGEGNQGDPQGSPDSKNRTGGGSGDDGISYSLSGRNPLRLPPPEYNYQVEGKVVVEVTVDRNGKVTNAIPGVKGSTTLNQNLLSAAKKAALGAVFDTKNDAPAYQKGTITYYFKLR